MKAQHLRISIQLIYSAIWISVFIFFLFYYPFSFNYEIAFAEQYKLLFLIPATGLAAVIFVFTIRKQVQLLHIIYLLLLVIIGCIWLLSDNYSFGNEHFTIVSVLLLFSGIGLLIQNSYYLNFIVLLLVGLFVYELYIGYVQFFEVVSHSGNISLQVKGSLQNSGIYSCYLVSQLPLVYYITVQYAPKIKSPVRIVLFCIVLLAAAYLIYITQSRTAYIAFTTGLVIVCINKFKKRITYLITTSSKILLTVAVSMVLVIATTAGYYLFTMKQLSAVGRFMKLDITMQHINDHLITGTGLGRFTLYYPQWQSAYFSKTEVPPSNYYFSAGESYIIFNEFLQLFKEIGLIGFILTAIVLFYFFRLKSTENNALLLSLKSTVICILLCSFTSYPFHVNSLLLLTFTCIAAGFSLSIKRTDKNIIFSNTAISFLRLIIIAISISTGYLAYSKNISYHKWEKLKAVSDTEQQLKLYNELSLQLDTDGKFLTDYGSVLLQNQLFSKAESLLLKAEKYIITRQQKELLAAAMEGNNHTPEAISVRKWLCNYLPNKFTPLYELMECYNHTGDSVNAKATAQKIITMPVKTSSFEVSQIIERAREILNPD